MNELPARSFNQPLAPAPFNFDDAGGGSALPVIDIPGASLKRDSAGFFRYWQILRRHKGTVALITIVGGLCGALLTLPSPRMYQARTTLELQGMNSDFLNMRNVNPVNDPTSNAYDTDIQTQVKILQSTTLVDRVRAALDAGPHMKGLQPPDRLGVWRKALRLNPPSEEELWQDALGTAAGGVRVRASGTTRIIDVTCDSTAPDLAAAFCNTLTREYIEENLSARWKSTEYTGQWLSKQLQDLKVKIEQSKGELQSYARETGIFVTSEKNDVQEARLSQLQTELSTAMADRIAKQSRYELAMASPPSALPEMLDDDSLKESQRDLAALRSKLAQLRVGFTESHAEVRRTEAQIAVVEAALESAGANIVKRIRNDFESAKRREGLLAGVYDAQGKLLSSKAEETAHYGLLRREVDASRLLYDSLQQRLKEASIASALRASNVRVVDAARPPRAPYRPNVLQRFLLGLAAGLLLGVGLVVLRERADRTLQDPGDVAYYLGLAELGVVPIGDIFAQRLPKGAAQASGDAGERVELVSHSHKNSLLAESYRTALTSILFSGKDGTRPRVIVLTSASPKEGKTTTTCNLAISLADINKRVLVVDGDLRRPRLHHVFGVPNEFGLSDLLMTKDPLTPATVERAFQETSVPSLFVMTSGGLRHHASSLLHSSSLPEVIELARYGFDAVIIDTPPMVNIADARVIGRYADALILVVRSGVTSRDAALLARSRFADDGIPVLGTILNFWNPKTPGYSYFRYYYDGYLHYYGDGSGGGNRPTGGDGDNDSALPVGDHRGPTRGSKARRRGGETRARWGLPAMRARYWS